MRKHWNHLIYSSLLVLLLLYSIGDCAEWYREYESGLDLMNKGRYEEAIPRLRSAISQKSDEGINIKFYGMKFGDYVPHYLLGRAYFFLKNYEAALAEFLISEEQGAIFRKPELSKNLRELKTIASAQTATAQVAESQPKVPVVTPPVPAPVTQPVEKSTSDQSKVTGDLEPKEQKKPPEKPAVQPVAPTPVPAQTTAKATPPALEIQQIPRQPQPEPADPVKMRIQSGARKYFEGDYDAAIEIFSGVIKSMPNSGSAHFLIGCSYASKFLLTGSGELKQKAIAAFQKAKQIRPKFSAKDNPYISPAVLLIFDQSG